VKRRDANRVLIGLAALGGGIVGYSFPLDLLDRVFVASGAAAAMPWLAPPLGLVARIVIVIGGMAILAGITAAVSPWKKGRMRLDDEPQPFVSMMETPDDFVPVLRRSDAHPDAPARPPLFASRDLGHEALPPASTDGPEDLTATFDRIWPKQDVQEEDDTALPPALEPMPWETIQAEMDRLLSGVRFRPVVDEAPGGGPANDLSGSAGNHAPDDRDPAVSGQSSIPELIARLERGLARRRAPAASDGEQPPAEDEPASPTDPAATGDATVQVG